MAARPLLFLMDIVSIVKMSKRSNITWRVSSINLVRRPAYLELVHMTDLSIPGILDLAVKHYEKVLAMADEYSKEPLMGVDGTKAKPLDLSKEAAYNVSQIYFTRKAPELARSVVETYLSL